MILETTIDNKEVKFKATASTAIKYRERFNSDLLKDLLSLYNAYDMNATNLTYEQLETFLRLAYTMAKQADSSIPDNAEDWLDEFDVFPIEEVFPQILDLWQSSIGTIETSKKK